MRSRHLPFIPVLLFIAPVLFFHRVCLFGEAFYLRDLFNWFYPWRVFAAGAFSRLDFPIWNPYSYSGTPFLANMQSGLLYPPNVVFWLFDFPTAMRLFVVIQFGLAGWFMYLLLRALSCRVASSLTGALGYAYGGWMICHVEFPNKLGAAAWLPLILLGVVLVRGGKLLAGLIVGSIATACCVTAGYPQTTFIVLVGAGVFWLVDLVRQLGRRGPPAAVLAHAVSLPAICLLGALLAAVQIVPFLEAASLSAYREPLAPEKVLSLSMHPLHFLDLLMPHVFGLPGYNRYWGGNLLQFWLGHFYVGLAVVMLAASAVWSARPRRNAATAPVTRREAFAPALTLLVLAALFCLGEHTPLAAFCAAWVPGFAHVRWMSTVSLLMAFPLCWLAALGLDGVLDKLDAAVAPGRATRVMVAGAALLAIAWGVLALASVDRFGAAVRAIAAPILEPGQGSLIEPNLGAVRADAVIMAVLAAALAAGWLAAATGRMRGVLFAALVPAALFVDLKLASDGINFTAPAGLYAETPPVVAELRSRPDPFFRLYVTTDTLGGDIHMYGSERLEHFRWAKETLLFNLNLPYGLFSASDGDPLRTDRSRQFHLLLESADDDTRGRFLSLANVGVILGQTPDGEPARTDVPAWMPRAHVSSGARRVVSDGVLAALKTQDWNPYLETIVEDDFPGEPRPGSGTVAHRVTRLSYTNNTVTIDLESESPGYLVLADTFYPGWVATVDGRSTPVFTANYLFRGIDLPAGRHEVRFAYRPRSVALGAIGSIAGLVVLVVLMGARRRLARSSGTRV